MNNGCELGPHDLDVSVAEPIQLAVSLARGNQQDIESKGVHHVQVKDRVTDREDLVGVKVVQLPKALGGQALG